MNNALEQLVTMSQYLGDPARPYAILGEGNTSARIDADSFYVKASGTTLRNIGADGFVAVSSSKVLSVLEDESADDDAITRVLKASLLDPEETRRPSVETLLHAILLQYPEIAFVGHTHPEATNAVLCSKQAEEAAAGRMFPDQIVVTGHKSAYVPYVDPGLTLAREVKRRIEAYVEEERMTPKVILMQNHGLVAMGGSAEAVMNITDMAEKAARILLGTYALGGPRFMRPEDVNRIHTRPDEAYRKKTIAT